MSEETTGLKDGDLVRLISGGPEMVVARRNFLDRSGLFTAVFCRWFSSDGQLHEDLFPVIQLVRQRPADHSSGKAGGSAT